MKLFLDTADPDEIQKAYETGMVDGVTTNPSLASKLNIGYKEAVKRILEIVKGPVSLEVLSTDSNEMIEEGKRLSEYGENVIVKLPMGVEGIKATRALTEQGIKINMTLVFSASQAMLAAKAGAYFVSPFIGRFDDQSWEGIGLIGEIREIYDNYMFETEILTASVRHPLHVAQAARLGSDIATISPDTFWKLFKHPMTDLGLDSFLKDFEKSGAERLA